MTSTIEKLEADLFSALVVEANFLHAKSELLLANVIKNGRGSLQDCACFLSDDCRSVSLYCNWHDDEKTIFASFELGQVTDEEVFDSHAWASRLMRD